MYRTANAMCFLLFALCATTAKLHLSASPRKLGCIASRRWKTSAEFNLLRVSRGHQPTKRNPQLLSLRTYGTVKYSPPNNWDVSHLFAKWIYAWGQWLMELCSQGSTHFFIRGMEQLCIQMPASCKLTEREMIFFSQIFQILWDFSSSVGQ